MTYKLALKLKNAGFPQELGEGRLANAEKIGKGCIIGAHALVTEKMETPDYALAVGAPAKVIRQLTPEQAEKMKLGALHYVDMAERHDRGEFPLVSSIS